MSQFNVNLHDELIYNLRNETTPLINSIYLELFRDENNTQNIEVSLSKQLKIIVFYDSFPKTKQKSFPHSPMKIILNGK